MKKNQNGNKTILITILSLIILSTTVTAQTCQEEVAQGDESLPIAVQFTEKRAQMTEWNEQGLATTTDLANWAKLNCQDALAWQPDSLKPSTKSLQQHFNTNYELDFYIYSLPRWLGKNIHWNDPSLAIPTLSSGRMKVTFEDWVDNSFDDVNFQITANNNQIIVTRTGWNTANHDPTHLVLKFNSPRTVIMQKDGVHTTHKGKNLDLILWEDIQKGGNQRIITITRENVPTLSLTLNPSHPKAYETVTVTARLTNNEGKPVANERVEFASGGISGLFHNNIRGKETDYNGIATVQWTPKTNGNAYISAGAVVDGKHTLKSHNFIVSTSTETNKYTILPNVNPNPSELGKPATISATIQDQNGNHLGGEIVKFYKSINNNWEQIGVAVTGARTPALLTIYPKEIGKSRYRIEAKGQVVDTSHRVINSKTTDRTPGLTITPYIQETTPGTTVTYSLTLKDQSTCKGENDDYLVDDDAVLGSTTAPVTMIEFTDYECPFCKRFTESTLPQIKTKYIDTGKVKFVVRDFPLSFHQNAQKAAEAAECAGEQGKYFEMHDILFENNEDFSVEAFKLWARQIGLNGQEFDTCLDNGRQTSEVLKDFEEGQNEGVRGTPAFYINGEQVSGAQPYSVFDETITRALNGAPTTCNHAQKSYTLSVNGLPFTHTGLGHVYLTPGQQKTKRLTINIPDNAKGQYDFNVKLSDGDMTAFARATLIVEDEKIMPPTFPEDEDGQLTVRLFRGWNIVSSPGNLVSFEQVTTGQKLLGYVLVDGQYLSIQQARTKLGSGFGAHMANNAFWVYSYEPQDLRIRYTETTKRVDLREGWNLMPIRESFEGKKLNQISPTCDFEKIYLWDASTQQWIVASESYLFTSSDLGRGILAKSNNYCTLEEFIPAEEEPEEDNSEALLQNFPEFLRGKPLRIVIGENAPPMDSVAAIDIVAMLNAQGITSKTITELVVLDTDLKDKEATNLIIIGRDTNAGYSEANKALDLFNLPPQQDGKGMLMLKNNGENTAVIVTGHTKEDVLNVAYVMVDFKGYSKYLKGRTVHVIGQRVVDPNAPLGFVKDTLREGETKTYTINSKDYEVTAIHIEGSPTNTAKFSVNSKLTTNLREGIREKTGSGALYITPLKILTNQRDGIVEFKLELRGFTGGAPIDPDPGINQKCGSTGSCIDNVGAIV